MPVSPAPRPRADGWGAGGPGRQHGEQKGWSPGTRPPGAGRPLRVIFKDRSIGTCTPSQRDQTVSYLPPTCVSTSNSEFEK